LIQIISSFEIINDDQNDNKLDDIRQIPSSSYYPLLPSTFSSFGKEKNAPDCLSKKLLSNMLNRDRRASISRPYFQHWRSARDNIRYPAKNFLAFSPRLGKRSYEDENESDLVINERQNREEEEDEDNERLSKTGKSRDFDTFLVALIGHLQGNKINIVYEDSTKICSSQAINNALIQQVLDQIDAKRREQHSKGKHPILFRYRLG
jgi:hypothetical protein